jgi:hypothetical protein
LKKKKEEELLTHGASHISLAINTPAKAKFERTSTISKRKGK